MLFDCIERVIQRKGHETLYGDPKLIASVIIRIFHQFKDFKFSPEFFESKNISDVIEIPFVQEVRNFDEVMGADMLDELNSIFIEHKPGEIIPLPRVKKILKQF